MARGDHGPRQSKLWASILGNNQSITADGTFGGAGLPFIQPETILRMIGDFLIVPTPGGTFVEDDQVDMTVGIGVMSSDAFAVGNTAIPDPAGEPQFPWLYWKAFSFIMEDATPSPSAWQTSIRVDFDIRSMRKVTARQTLFTCVEYVDVVGAPPMDMLWSQTRVLLGLH